MPSSAANQPDRRIRRRLLRAACALAAAGGLAAMLVLVVGRVASDRWLWSQPLFWIPGWAPVVATGALGAATLGLARLAGRWRAGRRLAGAVLVAAAAGGLWVVVVEWRAPNILRRGAPEEAVTLLAWNATEVRRDRFEPQVAAQAPDILIAINPPLSLDWIDLAGRLWDLPPAEAAARVRASGPVVIASRFPVVASGGTALGLRGVVAGSPERATDPGWAAFVTLDMGPEVEPQVGGAPVTIWAINLPSDPALSRAAAARRGAEAIRGAAIRGYRLSEQGDRFVPEESQGFPAPDIIVGDFNTTRQAASLAPLVGDLRDAHAAAGLGPDATWPRPLPLLGLDQAFVADGVVVLRYDVVDAGAGTHLMQRLLLELDPE